MKYILPILFAAAASVCSAACPDEIPPDKLASYVVSQAGEPAAQSFEIDLNSDGEPDKLLGVACGNAGCRYFIFLKKGAHSYACKGEVFLHAMGFEILKTSHNGMNDLLVYIRSSVSAGALVRYEHDGSAYRAAARLETQSGKDAFELIHPSYIK